MNTDTVYRELDDVKEELEKLKEECRNKTQLIEGLRKDRTQEFCRFQEAIKQADKQAHELVLKSEEICELSKSHEDLKSSLHEKELHIAHLSSENEKIQVNCAERLVQLEENNRKLVLDLDEMAARNSFLEQNACDSSKEISGLKELLSETEKKYLEAEAKAKEVRMLRRREDVILQLEEENINVHDKIKWRNEQFKHLEEAHEKLQVQYQFSKDEWEKERTALLGEVSSLQVSLDSQTRITEGLQSRLEMCSNALAHEESKRKLLEAEISEFKSCFENVFTQCEEKKSEIQQLSILRNEEIAQLRNSLGEKETLVKELERRIVHLEQDNQELGDSLKELREVQIHNAGANSLVSKLRNKLKKLEEVHKNCSSVLKSKESQWSYQVEKMQADVSSYKSTLTAKEQEIRELQMELEKCYHAIEDNHMEIEENHMEILIFKSELAEAYSKSFCAETDKAVRIKEDEDTVCLSTEELRVKDNSLEVMARQCFILEEELERQKKMLEESSEGQTVLKRQLLQMENTLNYERSVAFEAQEGLKLEITNKNDELSQLNCELRKWKSTAEALEISHKEIQGTCQKMEASLLSQIENEQVFKHENKNLLRIVEDQQKKTEDLQQQIALLEMQHNAEKMEEAERYNQDNNKLVQIAEEKDGCIKDLQENLAIACLKQESMRKEIEDAVLARLDAEKALEQEKQMILKIEDEKDQTIKHFQEQATEMEQDLIGALCFAFSNQVEKWVEVSVLYEALKKSEYLSKVELQEKNIRIEKSEWEINNLRENFAHSEQSFFQLKQEAKQLQATLETMKMETEKLTDKQKSMESKIAELKFEKEHLLQDIMKLTAERENMLVLIEDMCHRIGQLSSEDVQLMEKLGNIINTSIDENATTMDSVACDKPHGSSRDRANGFLYPPSNKKLEEYLDGRSPLREVNNWHM